MQFLQNIFYQRALGLGTEFADVDLFNSHENEWKIMARCSGTYLQPIIREKWKTKKETKSVE